jgi:hypothetical protein
MQPGTDDLMSVDPTSSGPDGWEAFRSALEREHGCDVYFDRHVSLKPGDVYSLPPRQPKWWESPLIWLGWMSPPGLRYYRVLAPAPFSAEQTEEKSLGTNY